MKCNMFGCMNQTCGECKRELMETGKKKPEAIIFVSVPIKQPEKPITMCFFPSCNCKGHECKMEFHPALAMQWPAYNEALGG